MREGLKRSIVLILAAALILPLMTACVNTRPVIHPEVTPEPAKSEAPETPAPEETEIPAETDDPADHNTPSPTEAVDLMGKPITGQEHFIGYLTFKTVLVYEEDGDTFMDCFIQNDYPMPISCAVDIVFREGEEEIARARLQTRDGSYLLLLQPGETVVFARILTDMTLTGSPFTFEFDYDTAIRPVDVS
jgi:hypothetical protein